MSDQKTMTAEEIRVELTTALCRQLTADVEHWKEQARLAELYRAREEQELAHLRAQRNDLQTRNTELVEQRRLLADELARAKFAADEFCQGATDHPENDMERVVDRIWLRLSASRHEVHELESKLAAALASPAPKAEEPVLCPHPLPHYTFPVGTKYEGRTQCEACGVLMPKTEAICACGHGPSDHGQQPTDRVLRPFWLAPPNCRRTGCICGQFQQRAPRSPEPAPQSTERKRCPACEIEASTDWMPKREGHTCHGTGDATK